MTTKLLTLYKIVNDTGIEEYIVSDVIPPHAIPLAHYSNINELVQMGESTIGSSTFYTSSRPVTYTKALSAEGKKRIIESSTKQKGKGNSQYGTRWIHSLTKKKSKKIRGTDELPQGWLEGRKIKWD